MSPAIDRLAELLRHLQHLREIRPRVTGPESLKDDLTLHNDVLFSLQTVCQVVIDVASEFSARYKLRFDDYTQAVQNLSAVPGFSVPLVRQLSKLPPFRNVLIHEYVALDFNKVIDALNQLEPVQEFAEIVRRIEVGS